MQEQEWMNRYLNGRIYSWQDLISSGRAPLEELNDGNLKVVRIQPQK